MLQKNIKWHNPNWPQIIHTDSYRILIIGGSGSEKTNSLFNLISQQPDIDNVSYFTLLFFIKYSNDMDDIYKNIEVKCKNIKYYSFFLMWLLMFLVIKNVIQK